MKSVFSVENMRKSDAATWTRIPARELMFRAGKAVFDCTKWEYPAAIVCGNGNNAGDGYVIASLMKVAGNKCTVFLTTDRFSEDGKYYYESCIREGVEVRTLDSKTDLSEYKTVFDCIFGTGFRGAPEGIYRTAIEKINQSGAYVVAVDINSGLNGDNGLCELCVDADLTVSIGGLKSGLLLNSAKDHIERLINVDIGIEPVEETFHLIEVSDIAEIFAPRRNLSNKGTYGYTALIGGSRTYSGAAKLSNIAAAALRSGTGVVKLAVPESLVDGVMPYILESTIYPMPERDGHIAFEPQAIDGCIQGTRAVAIGMGIGQSEDVKRIIEYVLQHYSGTVIIDADGLNVLSDMNQDVICNAECNVVLTPHIKEFSRLSGLTVDEILIDPICNATNYARTHNCILLLKGPTTIVTDGKEVMMIDRGCAGMASAGSGDVLSGILAAICGFYGENTIKAVAAAEYVNGAAGEAAQEESCDISMVASDTVAMLPRAIRKLQQSLK